MKVPKASALFWQVVEGLPFMVPAILAVFGSVVVALLLTIGLKTAVVWPLGLLLAALPVWLLWRTRRRSALPRADRLIDLIVLIGVVLWIIFNLFFAAQDVFVSRDPGVYSITGQWLITHQKTDIKTPPIVEKQNGLINYSGGIWLTNTPDKTILQPQGMHLLPALLGLAGRIVGLRGVLKTNIFFGGMALLSLYGFARLIMRRRWAALATLVMAVSLPMLYFSRHTYTEITAMILSFGGLSILWLAQTSRQRELRPWLWLLAGFVAGSGALTRPDAYLSVAAIAIYLVVVTALAKPADRRRWLGQVGLFLVASVPPMALALLDIRHLSHSYNINTRADIRVQLGLLVLVLGGGVVLIALSWRTRLLHFLDQRTKSWRAYVAGLLIILGLFGLMLRPALLYSLGHGTNNTGQLYGYSVRDQTTRLTSPKLASQHTMDWISWYIGLPMLLLGFVGMAIAAGKIMKDRAVKLLPLLMVVGLTTLMYGLLPRITLDQIWAIRRFLPTILPGLVVFGCFALDQLFGWLTLDRRLKQTIMLLSAAFIVLLPLSTSRPFWFVHENKPQLYTINRLCDIFPKNAQVIWLGRVLELNAVQTTRAFCGNETLGYEYRSRPGFQQTGRLDQTDLKNIAAANRAVGRTTILVLRSGLAEDLSPLDREQFKTVVNYRSDQLELTFYSAPQQVITVHDSFAVATLDAQGQLVPYGVH